MKKKIMNLLFEEEEEKVVVGEGPLRDISQPRKINEVKTEVKHIETGKSSEIKKEEKKKHSSFIDLEELQVRKTFKKEKEVVKDKPYEYRPAISPIFGILDKDSKNTVLSTPQIKKDNTASLLGTIYSPYYGVMSQQPIIKKVMETDRKPKINRIEDPLSEELKKESAFNNANPIEISVPSELISNLEKDVNHSLDEVLSQDENQEISLFDDLFKED